METITIPSPSAFLNSPVIKPVQVPPPPSPQIPPKRKSTVAKVKSANPGKKPNGIIKPKQSKSRNGKSIIVVGFLILAMVNEGSRVPGQNID